MKRKVRKTALSKTFLEDVLANRPHAVGKMQKQGIKTLADVLKHEPIDIRIMVGPCILDEIEIALVTRGASLHTENREVIRWMHWIIRRHGKNNPCYDEGRPTWQRGDITVGEARKFAWILVEAGMKPKVNARRCS